jgi:hypothetical protein
LAKGGFFFSPGNLREKRRRRRRRTTVRLSHAPFRNLCVYVLRICGRKRVFTARIADFEYTKGACLR